MFSDRRYQGLLPYFVTSFLLVFISIGILAYYLTHFGANQLYSQGKVLNHSASKGNLAVQIIYIHPKSIPLKERGTQLFLIGYADEEDRIGYIGLEAKKKDRLIKSLYKDNKRLIDNPYRLEVELISVGNGFETNLFDEASRKIIKPDSSLGQEMDRQRLVSLSLAKQKKHRFYLSSLLILILGVGCFFYAYRLKEANRRALDDFYDYYPELDNSLEKAKSYASFALLQYEILIYKTHLLTYGRDIRLLDLNKLSSLKQTKKTIQEPSSIQKVIPLPNLQVTLENGSKVSFRLKKMLPMDLTALVVYLNRYFPHIETDKVVQHRTESEVVIEDNHEVITSDSDAELIIDLEDLD